MGICCRREQDGSFSFRDDSATMAHFLFLLSDFSAFGNPVKKPLNIRGNYRKAMKLLLTNELDELQLILRSGEDFKIDPPIISKKMNEPKTLELVVTIPPGEAIKVYSIDKAYYSYLVNSGGTFYESNDPLTVAENTGVYF